MRVSPLNAARCVARFVVAALLLVVPCSIASAGPVLLNFDVTLDPGAVSDSALAVTGAVELDNLNGTNVGALLFDDEYIDLTSNAATTTLAYMIQGGLDPHSVAAGYSTSWPAGTTLLFSNFVLDQPGTLASVSVVVNQVVGAAGGALVSGTDYVFNATSLLLNIGSLGILDQSGQTPLGLMTFQLNFVADDEPPDPDPVPDPASTWALLAMSMTALAARRQLTRRRQ